MALDLKPLRWDWPAVTTGDTFPAIRITEFESEESLERVRVSITRSGESSPSLTLDSETSGVTIETASAGAWDFTIDAINPVALTAGNYAYDIETTDGAGTIRTEFSGTWPILSEITI